MLARLGIQKRIMAYVAFGLLLMFGAVSYMGMQAVRQGTELVFEERLAIAQSVAAALSRDFDHVARDTVEKASRLTPDSDRATLETTVHETFLHLAGVDSFPFLTVTSVWLLDATGKLLAAAPADSAEANQQVLPAIFAQASVADPGPLAFFPEGGHPGQFVSISVPLRDTQGSIWTWAIVNTEAVSTPQPFVPFGLMAPRSEDLPEQTAEASRLSQYHLEVLTPSGITILGIGPDENVGHQSWHYLLVKSLMEGGESDVMLHSVSDTEESRDHVMAVVPVPLSNVYLVLEQDEDVALALPNEFRRRLLLFGSVGFVVTLLVAWVTTRHVVKPTEELTAEAVRMARGKLSSPIRIHAQDEIGVLADNLEIMRQQLKNALEEVETANRELESRVKERTLQLQELVGRVLTAQEEERHRVALELHDETAQDLAALTVALDSVLRRSDRLAPEGAARLREARQIAADMLEGVRRLIYALRPVALEDLGVAAALRWYAEEYSERSGMAMHIATEGAEARVPDHVEVALFRIGQEALNNVSRHARASNVWITIASRDSVVSLTVRDDGVGFDPNNLFEAAPRTRGLGLAGMRERATLMGGRLTVDSAPGRGTTVRVEVPISTNG